MLNSLDHAKLWRRASELPAARRTSPAAEAIDRLACAIGVAGIIGKEPDVIAIAVLAQLLQLERNAAPPRPARDERAR